MNRKEKNKPQDVVSKLTDTTPGSGLKIMLDYINYRIINDRKYDKRKRSER